MFFRDTHLKNEFKQYVDVNVTGQCFAMEFVKICRFKEAPYSYAYF